MKPEDFVTTHKVDYKEPEDIGFTTIECLHFLKGNPWDEIALSYVHALRPTSIRVTSGMMKMDCRLWRVTVSVDDKNLIRQIEQEVEVGLPLDLPHGHALDIASKYGIDSKVYENNITNSTGFYASQGARDMISKILIQNNIKGEK